MKKIISVFLMLAMIAALVVPVAAETQETQVSAEGTGTEAFVLEVPEDLTVGGNAEDVTLSGTWPSNKTLVVDTPDTLELINSISGADKKTTNIVFDGIAQAGSNTEAVSVTKSISIEGIENALFGTWSGSFSYTLKEEYSSLANTTWKLNDHVEGYENVFETFDYDEQTGWEPFPAGTMLYSEYTDATGGEIAYELSGFSKLTVPDAFTVLASVYFVDKGCLYVPENETGIPAGWYAGNTRPYLNGQITDLQELFESFRPCAAPTFSFESNSAALADNNFIRWIQENGTQQVNP